MSGIQNPEDLLDDDDFEVEEASSETVDQQDVEDAPPTPSNEDRVFKPEMLSEEQWDNMLRFMTVALNLEGRLDGAIGKIHELENTVVPVAKAIQGLEGDSKRVRELEEQVKNLQIVVDQLQSVN